jgi:hypothetical protein
MRRLQVPGHPPDHRGPVGIADNGTQVMVLDRTLHNSLVVRTYAPGFLNAPGFVPKGAGW